MSWVLIAWLPSSLGHVCYNIYVDDTSTTIDALFHARPEFSALTWPPTYAFMLFANAGTPSIIINGSSTIAQAIASARGMFPQIAWCIQLIPSLADSPYGFPQALAANLASTF